MVGCTPIALYPRNQGWNIGLELRAGSLHPALESEYFLERAFPRLERPSPKEAKVLWRDDSGFDSARLLFAKARKRDRWAGLGRSFDHITKWNPRKQDKAAWVARAEAAGSYTEIRPDKRVGLLDLSASRAWGKTKRTFWLVVHVTERTIDKDGQSLLVPESEQQGRWTSPDIPMSEANDIHKH